jgi:HTH-type transcriptional regulator / antitoxin HigA
VHYKIPVPDAIKAVKQKMEEKGLQNKDLVQWIGSKGYVSALLNKKKPMTLKLAKIIHQKLGIPAGVILQ